MLRAQGSLRSSDLQKGLAGLSADELEHLSSSSSSNINEYIDPNGIDYEPTYKYIDPALKKKRCIFRTLGFVFFTVIICTTVTIIYPICFAPKNNDATTTTTSFSSTFHNGSSINMTITTATPPRPDIHLLCTNTTTTTNNSNYYNFTNCRNACIPASCCYRIPARPNDCLATSYQHCVGYMPYCDDFYLPDNLIFPSEQQHGLIKRPRGGENVTIKGAPPFPPPNLDDLCDKQKLAAGGPLVEKKCMDACLEGSCCMSGTLGLFAMMNPNLPNLGSCLEDHLDVCVKYNSCRNIEGLLGKPGTTGGSGGGGGDIGSIVHPGIGNGIWNGGQALTKGAADDNGDWTTADLPTPHNISVICSPTNVKTAKGHSACDALCFPALCCSTTNGIENSCLLTNAAQCMKYAPCRILDGGATTSTAIDIPNIAGGGGNIGSGGSGNGGGGLAGLATQTKTISEITSGLPQTSQSSVADNSKDDGPSTNGTTPSTNQQTNIIPIPYNISTICSPSNVVTPDGFSDCDALCYTGQCCLESEKSTKNCHTEQNCRHYAPCHAMFTGGNPTTACADLSSSSDGRKQCEHVCGPAMCCFVTTEEEEMSGKISCKTNVTEDWCGAFEVCRGLTTTATTTTGREESQEEEEEMGQIIKEGLRGWKLIMSNVPVTTTTTTTTTTTNTVDDHVVSSSSSTRDWMTTLKHLMDEP